MLTAASKSPRILKILVRGCQEENDFSKTMVTNKRFVPYIRLSFVFVFVFFQERENN